MNHENRAVLLQPPPITDLLVFFTFSTSRPFEREYDIYCFSPPWRSSSRRQQQHLQHLFLLHLHSISIFYDYLRQTNLAILIQCIVTHVDDRVRSGWATIAVSIGRRRPINCNIPALLGASTSIRMIKDDLHLCRRCNIRRWWPRTKRLFCLMLRGMIGCGCRMGHHIISIYIGRRRPSSYQMFPVLGMHVIITIFVWILCMIPPPWYMPSTTEGGLGAKIFERSASCRWYCYVASSISNQSHLDSVLKNFGEE